MNYKTHKILTMSYKSIIIFIIMLSVVFACKENSKEKKIKDAYLGKNLCVLLDKMREDDKKYREVLSVNHAEFRNIKIKKLTKKNRLNKAEIKELEEKFLEFIYVDLTDIELLTLSLIDIIKNIGYPNEKNSVCKKNAGLVFRHSQSKYFDEIKILINDELEKGNLNKASHNLFMDHINGRKLY